MGKSSKKGRITATQRQHINNRTVSAAMDGDLEDTQFARVLRHLGAGHVRIMLSNKREGIAKIKTALARRGSTPIVSDDIVVVSGRDFETKAAIGADGIPVPKIERFDIIGVLTRQQAAKLEKEGQIPSWFLTASDSPAEEGGDIFDFTEVKEETTEEELDIDAI